MISWGGTTLGQTSTKLRYEQDVIPHGTPNTPETRHAPLTSAFPSLRLELGMFIFALTVGWLSIEFRGVPIVALGVAK